MARCYVALPAGPGKVTDSIGDADFAPPEAAIIARLLPGAQPGAQPSR